MTAAFNRMPRVASGLGGRLIMEVKKERMMGARL